MYADKVTWRQSIRAVRSCAVSFCESILSEAISEDRIDIIFISIII